MFSFIIKYWVEILFSILISLFTHLYHKVRKYIKKIDTLENVGCLNLKTHIIDKYEFIRKNNYITIKEKAEIFELYHLYKMLGCSSVVEEIIDDIKSMPIK